MKLRRYMKGELDPTNVINSKAKTVKIKGRNGPFWLDSFKVVVGRTKTAVYFFSRRKGMQAPAALLGPNEEIIKMLDEIKVEMVKQQLSKNPLAVNPSIGYDRR